VEPHLRPEPNTRFHQGPGLHGIKLATLQRLWTHAYAACHSAKRRGAGTSNRHGKCSIQMKSMLVPGAWNCSGRAHVGQSG
jgi:hypothetical protein